MAKLDFFQTSLLAHLDFVIQGQPQISLQSKDKDKKAYKNDTLKKLAAKMGGDMTVEIAQEQLWQMFEPTRDFPESDFDVLFHHGSSQVDPDNKAREEIKEKLDTLLWQDASEYNPRTRRSRSIAPCPSTKTISKPRPRKGNVKRSKTPKSNSKRSTKKSYVASELQEKQCRTRVSRSHSRQTKTPVPKIKIEHKQELSHSQNSCASGLSSTKDQHLAKMTNSDGLLITSNPAATAELFAEPVPEGIRISAQDDSDSFDEILSNLAWYKERVEKAELQYKTLVDADRRLESISARTPGGKMDLGHELRNAMQEISILNRKLADRNLLGPRVLDVRNEEHPSIALRVLKLLAELRDEVCTIPVHTADRRSVIDQIYEEQGDLQELLRAVAGDVDPQSRIMISVLSFQELVQALTGAAICHWILESSFSFPSLQTTPLLRRYHELIERSYGEETLFSLDRSVHRSLIEEPHFKDAVISYKASMYSKRLVRAIRPLYADHIGNRVIRKLQRRLESIFDKAVHIRALSLISTEEYEYIWPSIGTWHDSAEMETLDRKLVEGRARVKAPIAPGLRVYKKKLGMVSDNGFNASERESMKPERIVRVIVIIESVL